jgi:hypothetical protein
MRRLRVPLADFDLLADWEGPVPRILLPIVIASACAGCLKSEPTGGPPPTATAQSSPSETGTSGLSPAGKQHPGELVHIAPDGQETVLDLGDESVATIEHTAQANEGPPAGFKLQFLHHRDGADHYEFTVHTDANHSKTSSPHIYSGQEISLGGPRDYGQFVLRPKASAVVPENP